MSLGGRTSLRLSAATLVAAALLFGACGGGRVVTGSGGKGGGLGVGGAAGSAPAGGMGGSVGAGGEPRDARAFDATDAGFASDFSTQARAALAAGAPSWTCATTLPNVRVTDSASMRDAVREFIAMVVGVPAADIMMNVQPCDTATPPGCAVTFAHDTAKSGGSIYDTAMPLAQQLEANATAVEETIWVPMQDGARLAADVVMSGISDGLLVGMVVFNAPYACQ